MSTISKKKKKKKWPWFKYRLILVAIFCYHGNHIFQINAKTKHKNYLSNDIMWICECFTSFILWIPGLSKMGLNVCPSFKSTMLTSKNHRLSVTVTSWKCLYLGKLRRYWFELNRYMLKRWYSTEFKKHLNFAKFCSKTHFCLARPIYI